MKHIDPITGKVTDPIRDLLGRDPPLSAPRQVGHGTKEKIIHEIFVVWEMVPESTYVYHLLGLSDDDFEKIKKCHGFFVNNTDTPKEISSILVWLNGYLDDKKHSLVYSNGTPLSAPIRINDSLLVVCGWII